MKEMIFARKLQFLSIGVFIAVALFIFALDTTAHASDQTGLVGNRSTASLVGQNGKLDAVHGANCDLAEAKKKAERRAEYDRPGRGAKTAGRLE